MTNFAAVIDLKILLVMKKILLLISIVLPFVLTSCGDDKEEPINLEQEIIGEWRTISKENYIDDRDYYFSYIFYPNYTGEYKQYDTINGELKNKRTFTWLFNGTVLIAISPFNEELGKFAISYENGSLRMIDSKGRSYTKRTT